MLKFILWVALVMGDGKVRFDTDVYYGLEDCVEAGINKVIIATVLDQTIKAWCIIETHV